MEGNMKKQTAAIAFGIMVLLGVSAASSRLTAQTSGSTLNACVGKTYGYPGCPLKVVTPPSETCGNGVVEANEECDQGNQNGIGTCNDECKLFYCGDGEVSVNMGEECEPEKEEVYVMDPETDTLTTEVRYLSPSCGAVCTAPTCDEQGNCDGGCQREYLPACTAPGSAPATSAAAEVNSSLGVSATSSSAAAPFCGNGIIDGGEQCDDGNKVNEDACGNNCRIAICGDAIRQPWEQCDDGNKVTTDSCSNECISAVCGDGIQQEDEQCDDGNKISDDGCTNTCRIGTCGDGIRQPSEACDDGNLNDLDGCTNSCALPGCGDGILQGKEECDDGNKVNGDSCSNDCTIPVCGDGVIQRGEQCDDGNTIDSDDCSASCRLPACGDGVKGGDEECDDGNTEDADSCTSECRKAACGDGILQENEECDDGNSINYDACPRNCKIPECGNGLIEGREECDLGARNSNTLPDICRVSCLLPFCGDGVVDGGEECDGSEDCTHECTSLKGAAGTEQQSQQGMTPWAMSLGIFGFAFVAAFAMRKELHGLVSKFAGEKVARNIDDIPLDEIEMPWHNWNGAGKD